MDGAKPVAIPLHSSDPLSPNDGSPEVDPTPYRQLVGALQYLAFTRPDVSFAVNNLSQFMHSPSQLHWQALKRVLCYLIGTIHHGSHLNRGSPLHLKAFSDSDFYTIILLSSWKIHGTLGSILGLGRLHLGDFKCI